MGYDVVAGLMVPGVDAYDVLSAMLARPRWHADAACRTEDTAVFFPSNGRSAAAAKAICATCPAFEACREWTDAQLVDLPATDALVLVPRGGQAVLERPRAGWRVGRDEPQRPQDRPPRRLSGQA